MPRKTCKIYYNVDTHEITNVTHCCNKLRDYIKLEMIFLNPDELHMINAESTHFKYCPECGARIIVKPSRL